MNIELDKPKQVFGSKVKGLRDEIGLSQNRLAEKARIQPTHLSAIERGHRQCGPDVAMRLAEAFGLEGKAFDKFMEFASATTVRTSVWAKTPDDQGISELIRNMLHDSGPKEDHSIVAIQEVRSKPKVVRVLLAQKNGDRIVLELKATKVKKKG